MDELHRIFIAYEMITEQENPDVKEVAFKASKRSKQNKKEQEEYRSTTTSWKMMKKWPTSSKY
jgi:hypothetical protein